MHVPSIIALTNPEKLSELIRTDVADIQEKRRRFEQRGWAVTVLSIVVTYFILSGFHLFSGSNPGGDGLALPSAGPSLMVMGLAALGLVIVRRLRDSRYPLPRVSLRLVQGQSHFQYRSAKRYDYIISSEDAVTLRLVLKECGLVFVQSVD